MTQVPHHRDAAHAAEEPGVLPEYGNDTGFAAELMAEEEVAGSEPEQPEPPQTEDH